MVELRNTIERLTSNNCTSSIIPKKKQFVKGNESNHPVIHLKDVIESSPQQYPINKAKLLKGSQYALSKTYFDKYGFKLSSSSSSANGGSGGHSSDDSHDSITLLKKRNFRDFQKQCTISSSGAESAFPASSSDHLCDDMKLLKLLEHERKKKAKLSHAGLLSGVMPASAGAFFGQRSGTLKRKRKDVFASELKQRTHRRKEAESSSD